jgi:hypothetical protein
LSIWLNDAWYWCSGRRVSLVMNAYHIIVSRQLSFAAFMMSRLVLVNFKLKRLLNLRARLLSQLSLTPHEAYCRHLALSPLLITTLTHLPPLLSHHFSTHPHHLLHHLPLNIPSLLLYLGPGPSRPSPYPSSSSSHTVQTQRITHQQQPGKQGYPSRRRGRR